MHIEIRDENGNLSLDKLMQELEWTAETLSSATHEKNPATTGYRVRKEEDKIYNLIDKLQEIENESNTSN